MTNQCRGRALSPFCLGTEICLVLIKDKMVMTDICGFCVIVGFKLSPQKGTLKQESAEREYRKPIRLLYDFTNRCYE